MLYGPMTHPQFLRALAAAGHGSKILLADANYPHTTGVNPRCELVSLNLAPGLLDVSQVLDVLKRTIPIERAEIMTPAPDADPVEIPIHDEFRAALPGVEFGELSRWDFDEWEGGPSGAALPAVNPRNVRPIGLLSAASMNVRSRGMHGWATWSHDVAYFRLNDYSFLNESESDKDCCFDVRR